VIAIAVPEAWNRQVLLYLHGTRPHGSPLVAELDVHDAEFAQLLSKGWMLATTSYRRHGLALTEALADALAVRQLVEELFEKPDLVMLEGRSLGGTAAILLAERHPQLFDAAVTVGAALLNARLLLAQTAGGTYANEDAGDDREILTNRPRIPIILMVNESEVSPARSYMTRAWELNQAGDEDVTVPALWEIKRPGHNWTTSAERLNAVVHAASWIMHGTFITRRGTPSVAAPGFEPTRVALPPPQESFTITERQVRGEVVTVQATGAFVVSITPSALHGIGIKSGSRFRLTVGGGLEAPFPVRVTLDEYPYLHTGEYDWCAVVEPEHEFLHVFVHTYEYCHAAKLLKAQPKTPVTVEAETSRPSQSAVAALRAQLVSAPSTTSTVPVGKSKGKQTGRGKQTGKGKGKLHESSMSVLPGTSDIQAVRENLQEAK